MSTILITGAAGYIGSNLTEYLARQGHIVHALCRRPIESTTRHENIRDEILNADTTLEQIFEQNVFDEVIHLATHYCHEASGDSISELIDSNISFGVSLLQAMHQQGCNKLINATTCAEFDAQGQYSPNSLYAASKKAFRDISQYYSTCKAFDVIDLVLYDNYGPQDPRRKIVNLLCQHLGSTEPIMMSPGLQRLNLVYIDDTVRAVAMALKCFYSEPINGSSRLYCVAPQKAISVQGLAAELERISGKNVNAIWGGRPYRDNEIMIPWRGENVPDWLPQTSLQQGLKHLLSF